MRLPRYRELSGFTEAHDASLDVALDLGEQAMQARLATRVGRRPDVKRIPPPGFLGPMIAMGPAFCSELVLPAW